MLNYVKLTGLQPDTVYYYTYGDVVCDSSLPYCAHEAMFCISLLSFFGFGIEQAMWCVVPQKKGLGEVLSFKTGPAKGTSGTVKFLAIADHGHAQASVSMVFTSALVSTFK